ncbi:class I SAM-dependent methyltransferase [Kitasatospora sp. NPDC048722]|uniref:class I SAM-dependent methyltransferase n=1 Tax=Kitasatospora sp. NPDC048722 TaxID=3155639 RepID=UPI0033C9FB4C
MSAVEGVDPARSRVFGEVAEAYDASRPGYADALVSQVLAYADLGGRPALEVGAGTGKATVQFAGRGVPLTCVEPDPRMAEVLRRNAAPYPHVRVEVGGFEEWEAAGRRFGLLFAATCWHWFAPERRWDLVHDALVPGGAVALFWNPHGVLDPEVYEELADVDRRFGVTGSPHGVPAATFGDEPGQGGEPFWPAGECRADGRFTDLTAFRYRQETRYGTERYLGFLASISSYRVLSAERLDGVLAETAKVLDARGGGIDMLHVSDLFLARRRA